MRNKSLEFLDKMAEEGENNFSLSRLRVQLVTLLDVGRNELRAYTIYLVDSGLIKETGPERFEINNDLRLKMGVGKNA